MNQRVLRSTSALVAATVVALAAMPLAAARIDHRAAANVNTVRVQGGEFFFRLSTRSAAKAGTITFVFKNIGHILHDFRIDGKQTPLVQPGKTAKLVITFKKGRFPYLCTVPGHAQAGMKGTFTVR